MATKKKKAAKGFRLSPSALNLFKDCPRCFYMKNVEKINRPSGPFSSLPSGMDLRLKDHYDSFRNTDKLPPELSELEGKVSLYEGPDFKRWRNNFKGIQWENTEGHVLRGAVDDILVDKKTDELIVIDYKTRGFAVKENTPGFYQAQLDTYKLLLEKEGHDVSDTGYLIFYIPEVVQKSGLIKFETTLVEMKLDSPSAEKRFNDAIKDLDGKKRPNAAEDCEFCAYENK